MKPAVKTQVLLSAIWTSYKYDPSSYKATLNYTKSAVQYLYDSTTSLNTSFLRKQEYDFMSKLQELVLKLDELERRLDELEDEIEETLLDIEQVKIDLEKERGK